MTDKNLNKIEQDTSLPCVFCENEPTKKINVYLGSKVDVGHSSTEEYLKNTPCCEECSKKYSNFMRNWIIATISSGLIFSFIWIIIDPFKTGVFLETNFAQKIVAVIFISMPLMIPVGLLFKISLSLTYVKKAKTWIAKHKI